MRRPFYGLLVLAWASLGAACRVSPPTAAEILATGFRSPEQAFRTFQTAVRGDLKGLGYRCLSAGFKEREGITELAWREWLEVLLRDHPTVRLFARAEILSLETRGADEAYLVAEVDTWFKDARFGLSFVREESYEIADAEGPLEGDFASFASVAREEGGALVLELPFPGGVGLDDVADVVLARRWKIDDFASLDGPPGEP
jgi:hypothetical protein